MGKGPVVAPRDAGHSTPANRLLFSTPVPQSYSVIPGHHQAFLALKRTDDHKPIELPVVWRRVEYLSSVPEKAFLGARPARVFLRCSDDRVELTRVLGAPKGIKAVVSSPRELTVMLGDDAPAVIQGFVEVGTTAKGRPPLRVPVVRFSVPTARN